MPTISELWVYPVKSLQGFSVQTAVVEERGLRRDRRWMLIDENNRFITQREHPKLSQIKITASENGFSAFAEGLGLLETPWEIPSGVPLSVQVWGDTCAALAFSEQHDSWFSGFLGMKCRLVYMPDHSERLVDAKFNPGGKLVSFSDGYPILIVSQASLDGLNAKLDEPVDMRRFRPNIVLAGVSAPHEEDSWVEIQAGACVLTLPKPCARCVLTTVNPDTGEKGKEPLKTLSVYRNVGGKVMFGQNAFPTVLGTVAVGNEVIAVKSAEL